MLIHFAHKRNLPPLAVHLNGSPVEQVMSMKFLGGINNKLTWSDHIRYMSSKTAKSIGLLRRLSKVPPCQGVLLFYHSYIRSYLLQ